LKNFLDNNVIKYEITVPLDFLTIPSAPSKGFAKKPQESPWAFNMHL
jgi:hypothetical protein